MAVEVNIDGSKVPMFTIVVYVSDTGAVATPPPRLDGDGLRTGLPSAVVRLPSLRAVKDFGN
tara:strand:+ start:229 stop:414 length:186 start_codon:yes stop_codon:yes gene_type:complete